MEVRKIKNKKTNEVMTTQDGKELTELRFEEGDTFIPSFNSVLEKTREIEHEGRQKKIVNYTLKCVAKDKNGQKIKHNGTEDLFVTLTPSQAKSLKKKTEEGIELNQNIFVAYTYESENYGEQIGLGLKKSNKAPINFEDEE